MADLKPYLITFGTSTHLVQAPNLGAALVHAVPDLTVAKPATGAELLKFLGSGGKMETAGEVPIDATVLPVRGDQGGKADVLDEMHAEGTAEVARAQAALQPHMPGKSKPTKDGDVMPPSGDD